MNAETYEMMLVRASPRCGRTTWLMAPRGGPCRPGTAPAVTLGSVRRAPRPPAGRQWPPPPAGPPPGAGPRSRPRRWPPAASCSDPHPPSLLPRAWPGSWVCPRIALGSMRGAPRTSTKLTITARDSQGRSSVQCIASAMHRGLGGRGSRGSSGSRNRTPFSEGFRRTPPKRLTRPLSLSVTSPAAPLAVPCGPRGARSPRAFYWEIRARFIGRRQARFIGWRDISMIVLRASRSHCRVKLVQVQGAVWRTCTAAAPVITIATLRRPCLYVR